MIYSDMFYLKDLLRKVFFILNISKIGLYKDRNSFKIYQKTSRKIISIFYKKQKYERD